MIKLSSREIAEATAGRLHAHPDLSVEAGVTTDSREVGPGWLFVAKPGQERDGHDFIPVALSQGAPLVLAERVVEVDGVPAPTVVVDDVVRALGDLAREVLRRLRPGGLTVVGVTGSQGKTTTKDLLKGLLEDWGPAVAPVGSYNSEVGVPLTVFRATEETRYLVVEMGANGPGHIKYLADIVSPGIGVELCVGSAHAGEYPGGVEEIARTKAELVQALPPEGTAVLNADDPRVAAMAGQTPARVVWFGSERPGEGSVQARDLSLDGLGRPAFTLSLPGTDGSPATTHRVEARLVGAHHVTNLLAAAAVAHVLGMPGGRIARVLSGQGAASKWRMQVTERGDGTTVVNDAYNANPESMKAALQTLAHMGRGRRSWAVLGEMLELGDQSVEQHDLVGRLVVRLGIDKLLVVGEGARALHQGAVLEGSWGDEALYAPDLESARQILLEELHPGDVVLFKSSNGSQLGFLGEQIAAAAPADPAATPPTEPGPAQGAPRP